MPCCCAAPACHCSACRCLGVYAGSHPPPFPPTCPSTPTTYNTHRQGGHPADARLHQVPAGAGLQAGRGVGIPSRQAVQRRNRRAVCTAGGACGWVGVGDGGRMGRRPRGAIGVIRLGGGGEGCRWHPDRSQCTSPAPHCTYLTAAGGDGAGRRRPTPHCPTVPVPPRRCSRRRGWTSLRGCGSRTSLMHS